MKRGEMKLLGQNSQKWAQESRFSAENMGKKWNKNGTKTEVSENGHFRVGNLEGRSAGQILSMEMVPQVTGNKSSVKNFFLRRSPNWPIS